LRKFTDCPVSAVSQTAKGYLVAAGILDVRIALKRRGMYHEKIGIITDHADDQVVFQGSANETPQGLAWHRP
jgi:hypothetical protein